VLEKVVMRSVRKERKGSEPTEATTLTSKGGEVDLD
jgi:hypothetical protein